MIFWINWFWFKEISLPLFNSSSICTTIWAVIMLVSNGVQFYVFCFFHFWYFRWNSPTIDEWNQITQSIFKLWPITHFKFSYFKFFILSLMVINFGKHMTELKIHYFSSELIWLLQLKYNFKQFFNGVRMLFCFHFLLNESDEIMVNAWKWWICGNNKNRLRLHSGNKNAVFIFWRNQDTEKDKQYQFKKYLSKHGHLWKLNCLTIWAVMYSFLESVDAIWKPKTANKTKHTHRKCYQMCHCTWLVCDCCYNQMSAWWTCDRFWIWSKHPRERDVHDCYSR